MSIASVFLKFIFKILLKKTENIRASWMFVIISDCIYGFNFQLVNKIKNLKKAMFAFIPVRDKGLWLLDLGRAIKNYSNMKSIEFFVLTLMIQNGLQLNYCLNFYS